MHKEKNRIEQILNHGEEILRKQPKLSRKSYQDVLDFLDDGSDEMISDRWGVTAWILVNRINSMETEKLVDELKVENFNRGLLTYEYAGYLLQWKYHVDLIDLLLTAAKKGKEDCVATFVVPNICYAEEFHRNQVKEVLELLENNRDKNWCSQAIFGYKTLIEKLGMQAEVLDEIGELKTQAAYQVIGFLRMSWYEKNREEAERAGERLLSMDTKWSAMAGIDYLETGLEIGKDGFRKNFQRLCELADQSEELWDHEIPVFIQYVIRFEEDEDPVCKEILERLSKIINEKLEEKRRFIGSLRFEEKIPNEIIKIFETIAFSDFQKDQCLMEFLDYYYARKVRNGEKPIVVVQDLCRIFQANQYREADYRDFFKHVPMTRSALQGNQDLISAEAIFYIAFGNLKKMFFGIGLLMDTGNITRMSETCSLAREFHHYSEKDWIRVGRAFLYFTHNGKAACNVIFQLLEQQETGNGYNSFFIYEGYANYPDTMRKTAEKYEHSEYRKQAELAKEIIKRSEKRRQVVEQICKIKDLRPYTKDQELVARAEYELNEQINKNAERGSIFAQIFPSRTLKYGARSGHIVTDRKQGMMYQSSAFMKFEHEIEMPNLYIEDPIGYEMMVSQFRREVEANASGD